MTQTTTRPRTLRRRRCWSRHRQPAAGVPADPDRRRPADRHDPRRPLPARGDHRRAATDVSWRAFDDVLSRSVLVHQLPAGDPDARRAARRRPEGLRRHRLAVPSGPRRGAVAPSPSAAPSSSASTPPASPSRCSSPRPAVGAGGGLGHPRGRRRALQRARPRAAPRADQPRDRDHHPTGNVKIVGLLIEAALRPNRSTAAAAPTPASSSTSPTSVACSSPLSFALAGRTRLQPARRAAPSAGTG